MDNIQLLTIEFVVYFVLMMVGGLAAVGGNLQFAISCFIVAAIWMVGWVAFWCYKLVGLFWNS